MKLPIFLVPQIARHLHGVPFPTCCSLDGKMVTLFLFLTICAIGSMLIYDGDDNNVKEIQKSVHQNEIVMLKWSSDGTRLFSIDKVFQMLM